MRASSIRLGPIAPALAFIVAGCAGGGAGGEEAERTSAALTAVPRLAPAARLPIANADDREATTSELRVTEVNRGPVPDAIAICPGCEALPPSCKRSDLTFTRWPLDGQNGEEWMINNYTDRDPTAGTLDYLGFSGGLARTYDGHNGVDIDISSFREMDSGTAVVRAAAPGQVTDLREDQFDRNTSCVGTWNFVEITHANGFVAWYGHLKKNSVTVTVGAYVVAGQILGVAGNSGCSTQAHLHFEVRDCANKPVETFAAPVMWSSPPAYNAPSDLMDVMLRAGAAPSVAQIKDPAPNVAVIAPGAVLGVGLSLAGRQGDEVQIVFVEPDGNTWKTFGDDMGGNARYRHMFPSWWATIGTQVGTWQVRTYVNGTWRATHKIGVSHYQPGFAEVAKHHVAKAQYQTVFDDVTAAGYMPVWVDGYAVNGATYFNAIFRPATAPWVARHDRTSAQYQADFDLWTDDDHGYRPLQVENYPDGGGIRYAVIFVKKAGPLWSAYHGLDAAAHQDTLDDLTAAGYRPRNVSVVSIGGARSYTALFEKTDVGSWQSKSFLTDAEYQDLFDDNKAAGRFLRYLNAYNHNGGVRFSAIWTSEPWAAYEARHHLTVAGYQGQWNTWTGLGYLTRFVTGYERNDQANFGAEWAK